MSSSTTTAVATPPRFTSRERLIVIALLGTAFMLSVDFSILNVALTEVGDGVGLETNEFPWIAAAYALPAAGFTLLFGRIADLYGRRRLFLVGMTLLVASSVLGGLATTGEVLLAARALQGLSTAIALPASLSLLTSTFAEGPMRDRVLGLNGALLSAGFTVGALAGGALVSAFSWRAAFFINVPIALAVIIAVPLLLPANRSTDRRRLDVPGAITVTGGLLAVVYAIIEGNAIVGAVGAVLLIAFWMIELRASAPLAPVRILTRPTVRWGNIAGLAIFIMEPAMIFLTTLYLQRVLGLSALESGLVFGIPGLASVIAGVIAGRFISRFGSRAVLVVGLAVQALATVPLMFLWHDSSALFVLVPALFIGFFGHVSAIVAYTVTGTSGLPNEEQGLATGLTSMTQQVAVTIGIPILSAVAATQSDALGGYRLAMGFDVIVTLVVAALVWYGLRARPTAI